ncbi:hypothetical protein M3J09_010011 [Ascochyta lentis]
MLHCGTEKLCYICTGFLGRYDCGQTPERFRWQLFPSTSNFDAIISRQILEVTHFGMKSETCFRSTIQRG